MQYSSLGDTKQAKSRELPMWWELAFATIAAGLLLAIFTGFSIIHDKPLV